MKKQPITKENLDSYVEECFKDIDTKSLTVYRRGFSIGSSTYVHSFNIGVIGNKDLATGKYGKPTFVIGSGYLDCSMLCYRSYKKDSRFKEFKLLKGAKAHFKQMVLAQIEHLEKLASENNILN